MEILILYVGSKLEALGPDQVALLEHPLDMPRLQVPSPIRGQTRVNQ